MITVLKANGAIEPFSEDKLISSITNAGINPEMQIKVLNHIKSKLYNNIPTREVYRHISEFLEAEEDSFSRSRYSLKESIMNLGPTGYPFEDYVAKVLNSEGYETSVRQILQGKCVTHEIDVIAKKNTVLANKIMVEVKYHNTVGIKTNIHVPMYTKSRYEDVKDKHNFTSSLLVTNTKATVDAIIFAECTGMEIITWSYPEHKSLRTLVEKYQLYPITALFSLPLKEKQKLMQKGIVLCKDICNNYQIIEQLDLDKNIKQKIFKEANFVCSIKS